MCNSKNMVICERVMQFYEGIKEHNNHRDRSWEHCYQFFNEPIKPKDIEVACLHLAAYLASWGMYRNSFLLRRDYKIHRKAIDEINKHYHFREVFSEKLPNTNDIKNIHELVDKVKESYDGNVSDTLASKILLGTLGCVPAYDTFFKNGIKFFRVAGPTLNEENYEKLIVWCKKNKTEINKAKNKVNRDIISNRTEEELNSDFKYPIMKIIDMYFWHKGEEMDRKKKIHNSQG